MRTNKSSEKWSIRVREKILQRDTLIEPHLVKLRAIRINKDSLYVSTLFNAMFSLVERWSVRECVNECIKMKKRHNFHEVIWSSPSFLSFSSHRRVNLKQTLCFVNTQKSHTQAKRWGDDEGYFQQIGSIKKKTFGWNQLCISLIGSEFA
jgi:hypothetical protein